MSLAYKVGSAKAIFLENKLTGISPITNDFSSNKWTLEDNQGEYYIEFSPFDDLINNNSPFLSDRGVTSSDLAKKIGRAHV